MESFYLGLTSLALTLINILCIIITGVLILRLKEVTPEKIPQKFAHFWREDIKTHRNYNRRIRKEDAAAAGLLTELNSSMKSREAENQLEGTFLHSMFERAATDTDLINIRHWVAMPNAAMPKVADKPPQRQFHHSLSVGSNYQPLISPMSPHQEHVKAAERYRPVSFDHSHTIHPNNVGTYIDVPQFLQHELRRSKEVRRRLDATE